MRLTGERWCEAEILRLQARLMTDEADRPIERLQQALELASAQGARLWELRIARDLATRLIAAGDRTAATALLAPVCNWFNEGRTLPDFTEAAALLAELPAQEPVLTAGPR